MRILHTSDWHLGRTFLGASLLDEQAEVVDRIVALAAEHRVDLVVIAGDLYDRAIPPAPAVELFDRALADLHATGAAVAAITGNHDSSIRVGINDRLLNEVGVAIRGQVTRIDEPLLLTDPADGGPPVAVYLVPYLEPSVDVPVLTAMLEADQAAAAAIPVAARPAVPARRRRKASPAPGDEAAAPSLFDLAAEPEPAAVVAEPEPVVEPEPVAVAAAPAAAPRASGRASHDQATALANEAVRRHLATLGEVRSVVVAHAFVAGGRVSDSERDLSVGGVERVALQAFAGFDLVALGHLHQPQRIDGDRVAYCGTPLPYSFSEEGQVKSVRIVDLAVDGSVTAEVVPLGVGRPLRTLTGTLQELLEDPALADAEPARVRARLTDAHLPNQAMARLRRRFPHAVELRHEPAGASAAPRVGADLTTLESLSPLDLALRFWSDQQGTEAGEGERALLERAVAANLADDR
ncbi:exonuclease SbcCD subunit D [Aquihabitans sp. G128]|uniref:exonuclease SbcCD subunit D n=1 Tax=Aquihabitans sp. G128 TaxID=2849779 RepID=UPI001C216BDE|nr:exonuclease SbcCD subunit D [Aquihabitans sp. G128]QXC63293.1 exonuclease SbcCD subunit D [Aquihabitans sp. G128]